MAWLLGGSVLVFVGVVMRRLLGLSGPKAPARVRLNPARERLCKDVELQLIAQSAILAVTLNDAIGERESGNPEIAWRLLELTLSGWDQLAEDFMLVLGVISHNLPLARITLPVRNIVPSNFKSDVMLDYVRLHEWVDQFLFRTKLRFHLQVRVLRHSVETLTSDFRSAQPLLQLVEPAALSPRVAPAQVWTRVDRDFHDFDLIGKETLLALRNLVGCLPDDVIPEVAAQLRKLTERSVRTSEVDRQR